MAGPRRGQELPAELSQRYVPVRVIGAGAMGALHLARDKDLGRLVAIKLMTLSPTGDLLQRFRREAEALAAIEHPNVVRVFTYGETGTGPYLVMEYLKGAPWDQAPDPPPPLEVVLALADALEAAHAAGVVHRDLKPPNVMVTEEGRPVLIDFGLARGARFETMTQEGSAIGSLGFLPQECLHGARAGPEADWFALGVCLFRMAEGRLPCDGPAIDAALRGAALPRPRFERLDVASPEAVVTAALMSPTPGARPRTRRALEAIAARMAPPEPESTGELPAADLAAPEPSPPSEMRSPVAPWIAGALFLLFLLLPLGSNERPPLPPAARRPATASPEGPAVSEDPDLEAARLELQMAHEQVVTPSGEVRAPPEGGLPAGWRPALSADPARWGETLARLPATGRLLARLGRTEPPSGARRQELEELEARFRDLGMPHPFAPFLQDAPPEGTTWLEVGATLGARALELRDQKSRELEASVRGDEGGPVLENPALRVAVSLRPVVKDLLEASLAQASTREDVLPWWRSAHEALRAAVVALARHARAGPVAGDEAFLSLREAYDRQPEFWMGDWAFAPPATWFGELPDTPGAWALRGEVIRQLRLVRRATEVGGGELDTDEEACWRGALAGSLEHDLASRRFALAASYLVDFLAERRRDEELLATFRRLQPELQASGRAALARVQRAVIEGLARRDARVTPDEAELAAMASALESEPEAFGSGRVRSRLREDLETLRSAARARTGGR